MIRRFAGRFAAGAVVLAMVPIAAAASPPVTINVELYWLNAPSAFHFSTHCSAISVVMATPNPANKPLPPPQELGQGDGSFTTNGSSQGTAMVPVTVTPLVGIDLKDTVVRCVGSVSEPGTGGGPFRLGRVDSVAPQPTPLSLSEPGGKFNIAVVFKGPSDGNVHFLVPVRLPASMTGISIANARNERVRVTCMTSSDANRLTLQQANRTGEKIVTIGEFSAADKMANVDVGVTSTSANNGSPDAFVSCFALSLPPSMPIHLSGSVTGTYSAPFTKLPILQMAAPPPGTLQL